MSNRSLLFILGASAWIAGCAAEQPPENDDEFGEASTALLALSNRVSPGVHNICINGSAFTGAFSAALNNAIGNYNVLGLSLRFTRTTGATTGCNAVITARVLAGFAIGSGFPSGGLPFNTLGLGSGFTIHNGDVLEHMLTHLLGHDIGLIHSDAGPVTPVSCGAGQVVIPNFGGSGQGGTVGVGVVIPPGTPPPSPGGSIMNTCIPASTNGEFTSSDIAGLNFYY